MVCAIGTLYENGVRQCAILSCDSAFLTPDFISAIKDARVIADYRGKEITKNDVIIILSQDCDVSNSAEEYIEILVAKKETKPQIATQAARNFRKLQLPFETGFLLCEVFYISIIRKSALAGSPFKIIGNLDSAASSIILDWRVGRYLRKPFPHKFNEDFLFKYLKIEGNEFSRMLVDFKEIIIDLHVFVDPMDNEAAEEYKVSITALVTSGCSIEIQEKISGEMRRFCTELHEIENSLYMIQIGDNPIPDDLDIPLDFVLTTKDFSLYDVKNLPRITLDYLCY
jgi:hypothetical protein